MRVAIIGAGWAGCAAALEITRKGHHATVYEASRFVGGRARGAFEFQGQTLDNGQHILIGAYSATLELMRSAGVDLEASFHRIPLDLRFLDGAGLHLPDRAPPWDALLGLLYAKGWSLGDKLCLARALREWRLQLFNCDPKMNVNQLCRGFSHKLITEFVEPLCLAALNTPMWAASAQVFLRVLRDSLLAPPLFGHGPSNVLLPKTDLSSLFPHQVLQALNGQNCNFRFGHRVQSLQANAAVPGRDPSWTVDGRQFDCVVLACTAKEAARLVNVAAINSTWAETADKLRYEPITTVYAHSPGYRLSRPMVALRSSSEAPAQFVFDKGQIGGPSGLLAFVISASRGERARLQEAVIQQGRAQLHLTHLEPVQTIVEKRATFSCSPNLLRPGMHIAPHLLACGDYVAGPYPATLEGAVRSALQVVAALPVVSADTA